MYHGVYPDAAGSALTLARQAVHYWISFAHSCTISVDRWLLIVRYDIPSLPKSSGTRFPRVAWARFSNRGSPHSPRPVALLLDHEIPVEFEVILPTCASMPCLPAYPVRKYSTRILLNPRENIPEGPSLRSECHSPPHVQIPPNGAYRTWTPPTQTTLVFSTGATRRASEVRQNWPSLPGVIFESIE